MIRRVAVLVVFALACGAPTETPSVAGPLFGVSSTSPVIAQFRFIPVGAGTGTGSATVHRPGPTSVNELQIGVQHLGGGETFKVLVSGKSVGSFTTNQGGAASARFDLPGPNIDVLDIEGASGDLVLHGSLTADYHPGSGVDIDATLELVPPFELNKEDVRAEFNTGRVRMRVRLPEIDQSPLRPRLDIAAKQLEEDRQHDLVLNGHVAASYTPTRGGTINASLDLVPDFEYVKSIVTVEIEDSKTRELLLRGSLLSSPIVNCRVLLVAEPGRPERGQVLAGVNLEKTRDLMVVEAAVTAQTVHGLYVDGVEVARLLADRFGFARIAFSSKPEPSEQPMPQALENLKIVKLIELKTLNGEVRLAGKPSC